MTLQWISASLTSGRVLNSLPSLDVDWPLGRTISTYNSGTAHLNLNGAPSNWQQCVLEGATVLACFDDDDPQKSIQWAGYVSVQEPNEDDTDIIDLTVATIEAYLARRYVTDVTYTLLGRNLIVADLIDRWINTTAPDPGIPLTVSYTDNGPVPPDPIVWQNTDNATVLDRITSLCGQLGGEFTIEWAWSSDGLSILPTLYVGDRVGTGVQPGFAPVVTFQMPGPITKFSRRRDYSDGKGANKLVYYSSGQGDITPYSDPVYAADFEGRPVFEHRDTPAENLSPDGVTAFAQQAIKLFAPGARAITMEITRARPDGRRLGSDVHLGDDIGYRVEGPDSDGNPQVLAYPDGLDGVGRMIAYQVNQDTWVPVLPEAGVYT